MPTDPVSGPMPKEKLKELVNAPHGQARKLIQHYDPQWGRAEGEKFEWKVCVQRDGADSGTAYVKAASQEEADALSDDLTDSDIEWNFDSDGIMVISVEPNKCK